MPNKKSRSAAKKTGNFKPFLIAGGVLLLLILVFGSGGNKKDAPAPTAAPAATQRVTVAPVTQIPATAVPVTQAPTDRPTTAPTAGPTDLPTLKKGSKGQDVKALQQRLIDLHYLTGAADGDFGSKTAQAVKDFQVVNRFTEDGVAGPQTLESLFSSWCKANSTVYKTAGGKVYHADEKCSGMKDPQSLTLVEAVRQGLGPCTHCH